MEWKTIQQLTKGFFHTQRGCRGGCECNILGPPGSPNPYLAQHTEESNRVNFPRISTITAPYPAGVHCAGFSEQYFLVTKPSARLKILFSRVTSISMSEKWVFWDDPVQTFAHQLWDSNLKYNTLSIIYQITLWLPFTMKPCYAAMISSKGSIHML